MKGAGQEEKTKLEVFSIAANITSRLQFVSKHRLQHLETKEPMYCLPTTGKMKGGGGLKQKLTLSGRKTNMSSAPRLLSRKG